MSFRSGAAVAGVLLSILLWTAAVSAQTASPPDPGVISREGQRARQNFQQREQIPSPDQNVVGPERPATQLVPAGGPAILLKKIIFSPSAFISEEELEEIAARYVDRKQDNAGLQAIVKEINELYAQRRIITALAYLPKQDIENGVLRVTMVEGKLGAISVKGANLLPEEAVTNNVTAPVNETLNLPKLERDVAWFNKSHNAQVQASLQPGANFGMTDVVLSLTEPPRNSYQVFVDNQGVTSVGQQQLGMNFQHYGLLGLDDKFTLYTVRAQSNINVNFSYNLPVNPWGGRLGVSFTRGQIHVYKGPYVRLGIDGQSENLGANFAQPIFVGSKWSLIGNASLTQSQSVSKQHSTLVTDNLTFKRTLGVTLAYLDQNYGVTLSPNVSTALTKYNVTDVQRDFTFFNTAYSGFARLPFDFTATLNGSLQWANQKLLPGDQLFQIGGPNSLRGFPTSGAAGYAGFFTNYELHRGLGDLVGELWGKRLSGFAFFDDGAVYSTYPKRVSMRSVGLGVSWDSGYDVVVDLSIARPLNEAMSEQSTSTFYFRVTGRM